jgi:hypothetical protein
MKPKIRFIALGDTHLYDNMYLIKQLYSYILHYHISFDLSLFVKAIISGILNRFYSTIESPNTTFYAQNLLTNNIIDLNSSTCHNTLIFQSI